VPAPGAGPAVRRARLDRGHPLRYHRAVPPTVAETLAAFAVELTPAAVPAPVWRRARDLLLDFLAVALRGSRVPSSAAARRAARALAPAGPATVLGDPGRLGPHGAALANGAAAHALELDDVTETSSLHPGAVVFPAALATAEVVRATPREFLAAAIVGYEVMGRLGDALNVRAHYARGFHPTATCGTFAAAAVASRLLGLDAGRTAHALGIAGSLAAGSMQYLADGALVKRLHPGLAAAAGVLAAHLAAEGLTGPRAIIEGERGFLAAYSAGGDPARAVAGLGRDWQTLGVAIKPHACCRLNHAAIDGLLAIVRAEGLVPGDVARVTAWIPTSSVAVVAEPQALKRAPRNVVDAQFSLPWSLAVALRHGRASIAEFADVGLADPETRRLAALVEVVGDDALDAVFPARWPARVEVRTVDGRVWTTEVADPLGSPRRPLSAEDLRAKVESLLEGLVGPRERRALLGNVAALDAFGDLGTLLEPLAGLPG